MTLPKIDYPINEIKLDSTGKKINFRPLTTKEEKLLLIAKASENENDIFTAMKQAVNNCIIDKDFDINKIPLYELEWFFLNLRIRSIGGFVELTYSDAEDKKDYNFRINLEDIKITYPAGNFNNKIQVNENVGIVMRYPPASLYDNKDFIHSKSVSQVSEELLISSIDKIWDGDEVHEASDASKEELIEFIDSLESSVYGKMQEFLIKSPHIEYTISYKNSLGTERKIPLRSLTDFFTF